MSSGWLREDDIYTLIGTAEAEFIEGKRDMPAYFYDLARRIALQIGDKAAADRCAEMAGHLGLHLGSEGAAS